MPAIAITDHGTMFGVIDFYNAATKIGVKPIIGIEAYLAARGMGDRDPRLDKKSSHLLLLAQNETGYKNLLKIASAAQLDGFYYYPRVDHDFLAQHAEGLICTSGCISAEIPRAIVRGSLEKARKKLDWYYDVFGAENFFLELQEHDIPELESVNRALLEMGPRYKAKYVATNDVHYIKSGDAQFQDILLAVQTGSLISDPNRMRMTDDSYYLRSPDEMATIFSEVPEAIDNTLLIAERCNLDLGFKGYRLPDFPVPEGHTAKTYLRDLCEEGVRKQYGEKAQDPIVRDRLEYELGVIHEMGFDAYFLIVWDLCRYAAEQGIWYNARGSAAGSIVAYALNITLVDPIEHGLIFERFLNPGRISMPDIDLDFRDDRRAEMMEYCARVYGEDKVAQIITFGTMKARAAVRDVGRVQDIPITEVDRVAKLIPAIPGKPVSIEEALEGVPDLENLYTTKSYLRELIDTAKNMEGVVRNVGTHAAGVIITDKPLIEYVPLHRPTSASGDLPIHTVTQFAMSVVEDLGLLKVDFLGLATLTIMARACDLIRERHGADLHLGNIPTDDPETYDLLGRGDTAGIFQVEGSGMRRYLSVMKPTRLEHVIAMVALFRPGPMDFIPSYIRRMHGEEEITYRHPTLEPIYEETYGIPVYQEQLMRAAVEVAGYTASEADNLRKAVAKKYKDKLDQHRRKFIKGAVERGVPEDTANDIFNDWEEFARYGFNKSHAADYGIIAVQTAYLKAHYPVEYMTALLCVEHNNTDKVAVYAADCRRMDIEILPPDVNSSGFDFTIEDRSGETSAIRFGLGAIKNVGQNPVDIILEAREDGPFLDLNDFVRRVDLRRVGKRALECLIKVGALDQFGSRPALLDSLNRIVSISASHFRAAEAGQMSLFSPQTGLVERIVLPPAPFEVSKREQLNWERELIGLYVSDHPLNPVMAAITQTVTHFARDLDDLVPKQRVCVAGLVTRVQPHVTKKGNLMGFVTLEDLQGSIDLVVFPRVWEQFFVLLEPDNIVVVDGRVDTRGGDPKILVDKVTTNIKKAADLTSSSQQRTPHQLDSSSETASKPTDDSLREVVSPSALPRTAETETTYTLNTTKQNEAYPQPPDPFPAGWELNGVAPDGDKLASTEGRASTEQFDGQEQAPDSSGGDNLPSVDTLREDETYDESPISPDEVPIPSATVSTLGNEEVDTSGVVDIASDVSPIMSPLPPTDGGSVRMVTVVLRPSGDKVRDSLRLRLIYGRLISYPGNDRFAFHIFEKGHGHLLEFPNFTTGVCQDLLTQLHALVGAENVRVEPITFQ